MSKPSAARRSLVTALIVSFAAAGCTRTVTHRLATYEPGAAPTSRPVPEAALYRVKVFDRGKYRGIDGTERLLQGGDVVGFRTGDDGVVYAVANRDTFPLPQPLERTVIWYASVEHATTVNDDAAEALQAAGRVTLGAGVIALFAWAISSHDDKDCKRKRTKP